MQQIAFVNRGQTSIRRPSMSRRRMSIRKPSIRKPTFMRPRAVSKPVVKMPMFTSRSIRSRSIRKPTFVLPSSVARPVLKMPMFRPTLNQRKPSVSLVASKRNVIARQRLSRPTRRPTIFSQKPFKITRPSSKYYRPTRRPSILTKYNRPRVDYNARYRNAAAKNRSLRVEVSKLKANEKLAKAKHNQEGKVWDEEKSRYNRSPGYRFDKVADDLTKRYAKATKVITPGLNGIGGIEENLSWTGVGLLGLLFVGLIIGRVE